MCLFDIRARRTQLSWHSARFPEGARFVPLDQYLQQRCAVLRSTVQLCTGTSQKSAHPSSEMRSRRSGDVLHSIIRGMLRPTFDESAETVQTSSPLMASQVLVDSLFRSIY